MKLLWLTLADPFPNDNGQFIYSAGLLHAAACSGCIVHAVGLQRPGATAGRTAGAGAHWSLAPHRPRSKWRAVISRWPMLASRTRTSTMRRLVREQLTAEVWDAIVFDGIAVAWAIGPILRHFGSGPRPKLVYVSHNHEERVSAAMAEQGTTVFKRLARRLDAIKMIRCERMLADGVDLVTANTPEDRGHFARLWPGKPVEFIPPGYGGPIIEHRQIGPETPRRAILVGSFHWGPKQRSVEAFLSIADSIMAQAGVELLVVGDTEQAFLDRLRPRLSATTFTGRVENVFPYMQQARLAVVPDTLGGFKLKTLDYVFNRLPIFAMEGSVPGLPLEPGRNIFLFAAHRDLAEGIVQVIDDFDRLNAAQQSAFAASRDQFEWAKIGEKLCGAIERSGGSRSPAPPRRSVPASAAS